MRIVPCALFDLSDSDIRRASAVTHAHPISMDACVTLVHIARELIDMVDVREALAHNGFDGLWHKNRSAIKSDGFVLHTLEAALWCLCTTQSYADCVVEAVNLGSDTDTTAAVAGALAALVYGFEDEGEPGGIPEEWMDALRGQEQFLDVILDGPEDVETDPNGAYGDDPLSDERMPLDLDGDQLVASTSSAGLDLFDDACITNAMCRLRTPTRRPSCGSGAAASMAWLTARAIWVICCATAAGPTTIRMRKPPWTITIWRSTLRKSVSTWTILTIWRHSPASRCAWVKATIAVFSMGTTVRSHGI